VNCWIGLWLTGSSCKPRNRLTRIERDSKMLSVQQEGMSPPFPFPALPPASCLFPACYSCLLPACFLLACLLALFLLSFPFATLVSLLIFHFNFFRGMSAPRLIVLSRPLPLIHTPAVFSPVAAPPVYETSPFYQTVQELAKGSFPESTSFVFYTGPLEFFPE